MCVRNGRAAAPPCTVCSIGVSTSRNPRETRPCAQGRHHGGALADRAAGLVPHDEVDVAPADPQLLAHRLVRDRQRPQRLRGQLPGIGEDRQLAAARRPDLAGHEHVVAEVDVGLPGGEGLLADPVAGEHDLEFGVALAQRREAELAGVAEEDDPAGDADLLAGHRVRLEVGVGGTDGGQRRRPRDGDRVGVDPAVPQAVELRPADPHLLGEFFRLSSSGPRRVLTHGTQSLRGGHGGRPGDDHRPGGARRPAAARARSGPAPARRSSGSCRRRAAPARRWRRRPAPAPNCATSSAAIRATSPSTRPAKPSTSPDCSAATVFLPIACGGHGQLDRAQLGGPGGQRVEADLDAGGQRATEELAVRADGVDVGRRAEVDDDDRPAARRRASGRTARARRAR